MSVFNLDQKPPELKPETLVEFQNIGGLGFDFELTDTMTTGLVVSSMLIALAFAFSLKFKPSNKVPGKLQILLEIMTEAFVSMLKQITGGQGNVYPILPLIGTIFIFIGFSNIITLFPPFGFMTYEGKAMFRTHTNDYSATFGIALGMIIITWGMRIRKGGIINFLDGFFPIFTLLKNTFTDPLRLPFHIGNFIMGCFTGLLDVIGEVVKPLPLSLRLFGNLYAGDVLMSVFFSLFAIGLPGVWTLMSLFSGLIQAIIFGSLVASYCAPGLDEE